MFSPIHAVLLSEAQIHLPFLLPQPLIFFFFSVEAKSIAGYLGSVAMKMG